MLEKITIPHSHYISSYGVRLCGHNNLYGIVKRVEYVDSYCADRQNGSINWSSSLMELANEAVRLKDDHGFRLP